jgi:MFS family permease
MTAPDLAAPGTDAADSPVTMTSEAVPAAPPVSLWRNRSFNLMWSSQFLSDLGSNMSFLAFPLLVLALTGSPVTAGVVGTGGAVARLAVRLPAGVIVDRVDRKRLMIACDAARFLAYAGLAALVATGHASIPAIIVAAVVDAIGGGLFNTAELSAIRNIVAIDQVPAATARNEARNSAAGLIGPPIGGVLFSIGRAIPFLADAISYAVSMTGVALIRQPLQQERTKRAGHPITELRDGLRFAWGEPFIRATVLIAPAVNIGFNGIIFAIVLILRRQGVAPALIGTVDTIIAIGGLLGAFCAGAIQKRLSLRTTILGISWAGVALFASGAFLTHSILLAVPVALAIFLSPATNSALFGYVAAVTPDELQGRVMSVVFTAAMSLSSVAPLIAGVLVATVGAVGTVLAFAGVMAVAAAIATASRGIRTMRDITPTGVGGDPVGATD